MDGLAWEQQHFLSTLNSETHMLGRSKSRKVSTRKFTRISYCSTRATRAANDISTRREAVMAHEFHFFRRNHALGNGESGRSGWHGTKTDGLRKARGRPYTMGMKVNGGARRATTRLAD